MESPSKTKVGFPDLTFVHPVLATVYLENRAENGMRETTNGETHDIDTNRVDMAVFMGYTRAYHGIDRMLLLEMLTTSCYST